VLSAKYGGYPHRKENSHRLPIRELIKPMLNLDAQPRTTFKKNVIAFSKKLKYGQ
jgi:hypothetical protein